MRNLYLVSALGLAGVFSSQGYAQAQNKTPVEAPVFSFLGDDTSTPTNRSELNGKGCIRKDEILDCKDYSSPKLGGADLKYLTLSYNRGLLYQVIGSTWANRYSTLLNAFTAKYGAPAMKVEKWQAKSGATFDNSVATWKFKDGVLELSSLGMDLNSSLFMFVSTANSPPPEEPTVDF